MNDVDFDEYQCTTDIIPTTIIHSLVMYPLLGITEEHMGLLWYMM